MATEDRYEIREKIGQGGVGAVYRAFDSHLNREVAIKRVLADGGYENQEEATKAMLQEAASLCSVQHPNIVTVFDSGVDDDGPFVVMELLSGRTIDEMIERGTLTLHDFREVVLQTQEALIAAQDLDLVHRDIKPTNVMVTWLPSGRFQVKLVDFGLAKFSPKPSLQTIDHGDSVFGSIHFMAPEQFERTELDKRTDMYSIGCVYYFCLAGVYPFEGDTAPQVMAAHLNNSVVPIGALRPDLPEWLCDWVMWHLQRQMTDRPDDARESLSKFLMSDTPNIPASAPDATVQPTRPKLIIPGATPAPEVQPATQSLPSQPMVPTHTAPQPILPPEGSRPSLHTQAQQVKAPTAQVAAPPQQPVTPAPPVAAVPVAPKAPTPPAPPEPPTAPRASIPVPAASGQVTVHLQGANPAIGASVEGASPALNAPGVPSQPAPLETPAEVAAPQAKKGLSTPVKAVIGATLAVALVVMSLVLIQKTEDKKRIKTLNRLTENVEQVEEVLMNRKDLEILLKEVNTKSKKQEGERPAYLTALYKGKATDNTDIDEVIAEFATGEVTNGNATAREKLFLVLSRRKGESAIPALVKFAGKSDKAAMATKALRAAGQMANASNFGELLKAVSLANDSSVKTQAVTVLSVVVSDSDDPSQYGGAIVSAYESAVEKDTKISLLRLIGAAGGARAESIVSAEVEEDDVQIKIAAIAAMRQWPDASMFDTLYEVVEGQEDDLIRKESFSALVTFLKESEGIKPQNLNRFWTRVSKLAVGEYEQNQVVRGLQRQPYSWAEKLLDYFISDPKSRASDPVIFLAEKAKRSLQDRLRRLKKDQ